MYNCVMTFKSKKKRKKSGTRRGTIDRLFASVEDDLFSLAEGKTGPESHWSRPRKQRISLRVDREVVDTYLYPHTDIGLVRRVVVRKSHAGGEALFS